MLKVVTAHSAWPGLSPLVLNMIDQEDDLFMVLDIQGLGPVNAAINTSPLGSMDGDTFVGTTVGPRNIVMTVKPNPNWTTWTPAKLRQELYKYFMPKQRVRLVFDTDEFADVEIYGYIETFEPDIFSKDGEIQISIICPYPYFTAVTATVLNGVNDTVYNPVYAGTVETGYVLQVNWVSGGAGATPRIIMRPDGVNNQEWLIGEPVNSTRYKRISTVAGDKYVRRISIPGGTVTNILNLWLSNQPNWPVLKPGTNYFRYYTALGVQNWQMTYYNRYGGL